MIPESLRSGAIQRVVEIQLDDDVLAVKSLKASFSYKNGRVLLNLVK
jgi:hypothetical protein